MSGGSYEYAFTKVNDFRCEMERRDYPRKESSKHRMMFAALLERVSEAMRMVEWEDSGDTGPEQTIAAINACFDCKCVSLLASQASRIVALDRLVTTLQHHIETTKGK